MDDATPTINLKVNSQDGHKLTFKMKRDTKLIRLLLIYCERKHLNYSSMRFLYNGKRIKGRHTPDLLNMEDNDEIDAMREQDGGC
ncbi:small ubiquitin-related modifier 1-like [Senna tora]|uniref:Small ubiquitin-related modifier 1-like n=1 Tax=Senna tora TaxID=362788 RepID=A0A835CDR6_9FABA|nr:small ubiquitin-related modifier 1-like [Senna tora]